jgi:Copper amine oxidase, enzyme domain
MSTLRLTLDYCVLIAPLLVLSSSSFSSFAFYAVLRGDFPNQMPGVDGLPLWVKKNRSIVDEDLVVWHVFGVTHVSFSQYLLYFSSHHRVILFVFSTFPHSIIPHLRLYYTASCYIIIIIIITICTAPSPRGLACDARGALRIPPQAARVLRVLARHGPAPGERLALRRNYPSQQQRQQQQQH